MRQRKCVSIIWHVPFPRDEGEIMTVAKRILKKLKRNCLYIKLEKWQLFVQQISNLSIKIPKHLIWGIYIELTMDESAEQNPEIDERVCQAILGEDLDLVIDLSQLDKGRPRGTFDVLFSELEKVTDQLKATGISRSGVTQLSDFRSAKDTDVKWDNCFVCIYPPKCLPTRIKTLQWKGKLRFEVKSWQLRALYADQHY